MEKYKIQRRLDKKGNRNIKFRIKNQSKTRKATSTTNWDQKQNNENRNKQKKSASNQVKALQSKDPYKSIKSQQQKNVTKTQLMEIGIIHPY